MPKTPTVLPPGLRTTDIITATQFAVAFPIGAVNRVLDECSRGTVRVRKLPNELVVYFVMMLALFRDCSHKEVFRCVAQALGSLVGKGDEIEIPSAAALSLARTRVSHEPMELLFQEFAVPAGLPGEKGVWYRNWRMTAFDGSLINVEDTLDNRKTFGSARNQHGTAARNPQVRFVSLMEIGTHLFCGAAMGGFHEGEITLVSKLVPLLKPDMICLADRNFFSFDLFNAITKTGAALVFRVQRGMNLESEERLEDGSHLVTIYSSKDRKKENPLKARFIQYQVLGAPTKETIFLVTNILEPTSAPAEELAALYHQRWEYENALDELKTHLNAKAIVLRSKTPALVLQELWGMLMTHYVIRLTMHQAAVCADLDPDILSFVHSVRVIRRALVKSASDFSP